MEVAKLSSDHQQRPENTDTATESSKPFRLMDLPQELRLMIYERLGLEATHYYSDETMTPAAVKKKHTTHPSKETPVIVHHFISPAILQVNLQIRSEAYRIVHNVEQEIAKRGAKLILRADNGFHDGTWWGEIGSQLSELLIQPEVDEDIVPGNYIRNRIRQLRDECRNADRIKGTGPELCLEVALQGWGFVVDYGFCAWFAIFGRFVSSYPGLVIKLRLAQPDGWAYYAHQCHHAIEEALVTTASFRAGWNLPCTKVILGNDISASEWEKDWAETRLRDTYVSM